VIGALASAGIPSLEDQAVLIDRGGPPLFVTSGIGMSILPVRFLVPPEIAIVRMRSLATAPQVSKAARAR
jgi:predicted MPP superfamily phosphohydrolase